MTDDRRWDWERLRVMGQIFGRQVPPFEAVYHSTSESEAQGEAFTADERAALDKYLEKRVAEVGG